MAGDKMSGEEKTRAEGPEEGEHKKDRPAESAPAAAPPAPPGGEEKTGTEGGPRPEATEGGPPEGYKPGELMPLDLSTFILSLSSSVLMNLGVVENPVTKKIEKDPAAAKQTLDLIELLKDKTRGNLTEAEEKLFDDILYELRLWYCKVVG
ncbi:MAG: DUF1844 domain-containing protein [Thermodesulfobacteriota bacterium]